MRAWCAHLITEVGGVPSRRMIYQWLILQDGSLPLKADGRRNAEEHVCTSVLVWPAGSAPTSQNSLLVDPCFSRSGMQLAQQRLADRLDVLLAERVRGRGDHRVHWKR
jgi:hypothetical protein